MTQIRVTYNDPPVHCLDVLNTQGKRLLRMRPNPQGVLIESSDDVGSAQLTKEEVAELADALSRLAR